MQVEKVASWLLFEYFDSLQKWKSIMLLQKGNVKSILINCPKK